MAESKTSADSRESISEDELFDPLLECLVITTQLKQVPYSADALKAGLPLENNRLTPELFVRAAKRAGLNCRVVRRTLNKISPLVLPVVLILKDEAACVVEAINKNGTVDVYFPELGKEKKRIKLNELNQQYSGYVIFVQREQVFESRAEEADLEAAPRSWFWGTLWRFRRYYVQVILASFLINLFALAVPLFVMNVYDRVVPNNAIETLWVLAVGVCIVFFFDFLMRTLRGFFIDMAGKKVDVIIASQLFEQALGIKIQDRPESTGVQANQLREFENIRDFFTSATVAALVDLPFISLFLWVIWMIGGMVAIIPTLAVPIVIITAILISIPLNRAVARSFMGGSQKNAILFESLNNLEVIKSLSAEGTLQKKWERFVGITANSALTSRFYSMLAVNLTTLVHYGVTVSVVVVGVHLIQAKELTVGGLIACTILSGRALAPLAQITSLLTRYQLTKFSLKALDNMMHLPVERPVRHKFLHRASFAGAIEFEEVGFSYPNQVVETFKSVSFEIKPGERVGILGSMGAGKTTLLKLIMGFYAPTKGAVRIDGADIAQIDPADLRRHIGYVQQEPKLFFGTVRENICMKAPWVSDETILKASRLSGADQFIGRHPAGYDLPVGENGQGLSGGQCQTITLARALLLSPKILLLDEPTSSMDNATEQLFLRQAKEFLPGRTLVVVTHKMGLLSLVDRLIVLQGGRVVADGSKQQVLSALKQLQQGQ